jgi:tetratricopeptide (TPR) repeat protein
MPPDETPKPTLPPQEAPPPPASPPPAPQEELPDLSKWFQRLIYQYFGRWGLIMVAVLVVVVPLVWSNWSTVRDLPGMATIRTWLSQAPLPTVDPQRFAVALAHLEHDQDQQSARFIREVLREFEGVQLLQFDRTISLEGTQPEEREQQGHAQARQYLEASGAHVLIWGLVLRQDGKSAPRLYWTTLREHKRAKEPYQLENFKLPDLFWSDLADVLRLVVATQYSAFKEQEGRFIADQLPPFITRVRRLLDKSAGRQEWSTIQFLLGNALLTYGEQTGTNQPLEEAVAAYRNALQEYTRERVPLDWAMTQNNLGNALRTLGEREKDATSICEALGKQLMAWEVFSIGAPYYATGVVNNAKRTVASLKDTFDSSTYESCVAQYAEALKRIGLH